MAGILFLLSFKDRYAFLLKALPVILLMGAISALVSVILGWLLSSEGGYAENTLFWHQWLGISVAFISVLGWLYISGFLTKGTHSKPGKLFLSIEAMEKRIHSHKKNVGWTLGVLVVLVSITGHLGGSLTHGEQYLFAYAPPFLQTLMVCGEESRSDKFEFHADPDSVLLFGHLIEPVLIQKCASCHNENMRKGGLLLTTQEALLQGGDNGAVLEKGSAYDSELFKRVSLDPGSMKFMPSKGVPMSYTEITLLQFWINNGMSFDLTIAEDGIPEEIQLLISDAYGISAKKKPFYEKEKVSPASGETLESLRSLGYRIKKLSEDNNFLEVVAKDSLTKEKIEALLAIKDQITWLDLGRTGLQDSWMATFAQFGNLTRLKLDNNNISDAAVVNFENLNHLETLNIHSTAVGDTGLRLLAKKGSLKKIYLWNTKVSREVADAIQQENPSLAIDLGVNMTEK